jgi:transcriptional regulator with XRE-family HTH domain
MDRQELGLFLRSRRERIDPGAIGMPAGARRRTPGLRREEVATLAHISAEYYVRLEQGRAPRPSLEVLAALGRALRLNDAEVDHLHHLAGTPPAPPHRMRLDVRPSERLLLDRMPGTAAFVTSAAFDVLAWNDLAGALLAGLVDCAPRDRNLARRAFLPIGAEPGFFGVSDRDEFCRNAVLQLRATAARYPDDPHVSGLLAELRRDSAEFAALWEAHDVDAAQVLTKTFDHPVVGPITVDCATLDIADRDQRVVLYTTAPGSPSAQALELLAVIGTERMGVDN